MAAKVVMVAVPTVLGIASIRVYTVSEAPTDGVRREKLNIYTPLPPSAQVKFLPESPGVIESGFTTAREGVLPVYRAVKGAGVSVKTGTINLYHAGEDVFYYLKDPPPGFLPRFGTITMAGLLGMFLTRKGSHFKKLAVPLGLMSAGASVCYPAQAVALCKVTGKKLYTAGQWSGATVSSLFVSKEPAAKKVLAPQLQSATIPNSPSEPSSTTDTKSQSSIPETEVESAESASIPDEPVGAVITGEDSSVTLSEISPDPVPTETGSESLMPSEAETTPAATEAPEQATEEVSADFSSAEPAPSSETIEAAPDEPAAASSALAEPAAAESAPAEPAAAESAPAEPAAAESAPAEPAAAESAPAEPAAAESAPAEPAPVESAAIESTLLESALTESAPLEASPADPAAVESATPQPAPVEAPPVESAAVESAPAEPTPVEAAPSESAPVESASAEAAPIESAPSSDESAPDTSDEPAGVESSEPVAPPPEERSAADSGKEGSSFKPDPSLVDFGQSSPEDEDLYSTRS